MTSQLTTVPCIGMYVFLLLRGMYLKVENRNMTIEINHKLKSDVSPRVLPQYDKRHEQFIEQRCSGYWVENSAYAD